MTKRIGMVFPGQGAQYAGMAKDLYDAFPECRDLYSILSTSLPADLLAVMFAGPEETLKQTEYTQPAIFLHSLMVMEVLSRRNHIVPACVCGHSIGEYAALTAAGVLDRTAAAALVTARSRFMAEDALRQKGTMAAVLGLDDEKVRSICATVTGVCVPANYNCPGQVVISGDTAGVANATAALKAQGAKRVMPLSVSGAWHSPLMRASQRQLADLIEAARFSEPRCPVISNVSAVPVTDAARLKQDLKNQICSPVAWTASMNNAAGLGLDLLVEAGPGTVLAGLMKRINKEIKIISVGKSENLAELGGLFE